MIEAIYKYEIPMRFGVHTLEMPDGAYPLSCMFQKSVFGEGLMLWAAIPSRLNRMWRHRIAVRATGVLPEQLYPSDRFLATVQLPGGEIAHVFDLGPHP